MVFGEWGSAGTKAGAGSWTQTVLYTISQDRAEQRRGPVAAFGEVKPEWLHAGQAEAQGEGLLHVCRTANSSVLLATWTAPREPRARTAVKGPFPSLPKE